MIDLQPTRRRYNDGVLRITAVIDASAIEPLRNLLYMTFTAEKQKARQSLDRANMDYVDQALRDRHANAAQHHSQAAAALERLFFGLMDAIADPIQPEVSPEVQRAYDLADHVSPDPTTSRAALRLLRLECETLRSRQEVQRRLPPGAIDLEDIVERAVAGGRSSCT